MNPPEGTGCPTCGQPARDALDQVLRDLVAERVRPAPPPPQADDSPRATRPRLLSLAAGGPLTRHDAALLSELDRRNALPPNRSDEESGGR